MIGDFVLEYAGAKGRARALEQVEILEKKRHAGERTVRKSLVDLALGEVVMPDNDCVDLRIDLRGAGNGLVQ